MSRFFTIISIAGMLLAYGPVAQAQFDRGLVMTLSQSPLWSTGFIPIWITHMECGIFRTTIVSA